MTGHRATNNESNVYVKEGECLKVVTRWTEKKKNDLNKRWKGFLPRKFEEKTRGKEEIAETGCLQCDVEYFQVDLSIKLDCPIFGQYVWQNDNMLTARTRVGDREWMYFLSTCKS